MAWTLGWTELISWGILFYAFSALLVPMEDEFGWSTGLITGAYSLSILVSGLLAPVIGRWIDAHGARWLMTGGSILGSIMLVAWSRVESVSGFYLVWIGMGVAMACTLYEPAFAAIAPWYRRNRGKAMLIITFLGGLASTVFLPATGWLDQRYGWRDALTILAVFLAVTTILPHALVLNAPPVERTHAQRPSLVSSFRDLMQTAWFRRFSFAFFLQSFVTNAVAVYMIAYLIDQGVSPTTAAITAGIIGAAQTGARVIVTVFERYADVTSLTSWMFALQFLAVLVLVIWPTGSGMLIAAILLGFGRGALTLLRPTILLNHYEVQRFGAVNGSLAAILTIAAASAPVVTGVVVGWLNGYTVVFAVYAAIALASAIVLVSTRWVTAPVPVDAR
ncbi:MAG: MFS transporter [Thermomicrobiales bacterium]|nr:MFS transporter [Thermomicrobiales bacterium]